MTRHRMAIALILMLLNIGACAAVLKTLSIQERDQQTVVLLNLSGPFAYKTFTLSNPSRVVVDFMQTTLQENAALPQKHALISNIRVGHPKKHLLRLVFDVTQRVHVTTKESARALQINLQPNTATHRPKASKQANPPAVKVARSPAKSLRDVVVIIDPGHGGKDPGAIGAQKHLEKNLVLAIALKLKAIINKEPGMRAILTRNGDYYVGLRERLKLARKHDGDVFLSIHADAFINKKSNGASVFALSSTGATSEAARWLAEKENHSELGGVNLSELDDQNDVIRSVLIDLSQTATIGASLEMGSSVLHALDKLTVLHHQDVEQARFVVLKSPDIPSILVETGFISNPREEKNLSNAAYQKRIAQAIFQGVRDYFFAHPPFGSRIEAMIKFRRHYVKKGETLASIASLYQVTIQTLKNANELKSDRILQGQWLTIPSTRAA